MSSQSFVLGRKQVMEAMQPWWKHCPFGAVYKLLHWNGKGSQTFKKLFKCSNARHDLSITAISLPFDMPLTMDSQCFKTMAECRYQNPTEKRRGARVVDRDGLENRCTGNRTEGSNPSLSARYWKSGRCVFLAWFSCKINTQIKGFGNESSGEATLVTLVSCLKFQKPCKLLLKFGIEKLSVLVACQRCFWIGWNSLQVMGCPKFQHNPTHYPQQARNVRTYQHSVVQHSAFVLQSFDF